MKLSFGGIVIGVLSVAVTGSGFGVVYAKHESRELFIELQTLQDARDELNVEWGQLQLEQSTLATYARIDATARATLRMNNPLPEAVVIVRP